MQLPEVVFLMMFPPESRHSDAVGVPVGIASVLTVPKISMFCVPCSTPIAAAFALFSSNTSQVVPDPDTKPPPATLPWSEIALAGGAWTDPE